GSVFAALDADSPLRRRGHLGRGLSTWPRQAVRAAWFEFTREFHRLRDLMMIRHAHLAFAGLVAFFASAIPASAHDGHLPEKVADATAHRPTAIPDRIILTWTGDTARTQAVSWRTDATVEKAFAEIAPASAAPKFVEGAKRIDAVTQPLQTNLGP